MKVLTLLGSPKKDGNTAALLKAFTDGAASKGHEVEAVWLHEKNITPCNGCRFCKVDGVGTSKCVHDDDMTELYRTLKDADVIVHAFPVYWWSMPAQTKVMMDRIYAMDYSLFNGKAMYFLTTYNGTDPNSGAALCENTLKEICASLGMDFKGSIAVSARTTPVKENKEALERAFRMGTEV